MKWDAIDVMLGACAIAAIVSLVAINAISKSNEIKLEQMRNEHELQEYKLVTELTEAEAKLIYAKALDISCTSKLVSKWGEVYSR